MNVRLVLVGLTLASVAGVAAAAPVSAIRLSPLTARFYYTDRGDWSGNMFDKDGHYSGWNSIIGEGDAGGPFDDVMIDVGLAAPGSTNAINVDQPLVLKAFKGKRVIATRTNRNMLIPLNGQAHVALFLVDVGCGGTIDVVATYKKQVRKGQLAMACGE